MNVLILGSGGREHAIAHKVSQSKLLNKLYIAPGNDGTAQIGSNIPINVNQFEEINSIISEKNIDMLIVGPEVPLSDGIVDYLTSKQENKTLKIIGPTAAGAKIESSKDYAKHFMNKYGIPTAKYKSFTPETYNDGCTFIDSLPSPYVLKADGLAAGKGVLIINDKETAKEELHKMLFDDKFGRAGSTVVIEEFLRGIELSVFALVDGKNYVLLPEAKDYKRIGNNDTGLNTGGMGSVSPVPFANATFMKKVEDTIIKPTIDGLVKENIVYRGFIFFGLMNCDGTPYVIEYNCRMGDPETESSFPRIKNDILDLFDAAATGRLQGYKVETDKRSVATVMLVSEGYPEKYEKNKKITIDTLDNDELTFHCGTKHNSEGELLSDGGRVITATAFGNTLQQALTNAYNLSDKIHFENKYLRSDIGHDLLNDK